MSKINLAKWAKDNIVILVVVPIIVGFHWGWYKIQSVPYLVDPSEQRKEMPLVSALKAYKTHFFSSNEAGTKESPNPEKK